MGYKIKHVLKKSKMIFIVVIILWVFATILFVPPFTISRVEATVDGVFQFDLFIEHLIENIGSVGNNFGRAFGARYIGTYFNTQIYLIIALIIMTIVGMIKSMPKHEYTDTEHGSSDWCERGEEYKILSKNKGILLAEKEYLPVDKRGNVNVLVVGRIWFW
ncbi:MAG: hypothetical protein FWC68_00270 [Oscillospiraceae bacterium]|nr:hypothetical protein [Oscillospiraceae bacterium]